MMTVTIASKWTDSFEAHDTDPRTGKAIPTQSWAWTTTGDVVVRDSTDGITEYVLIRQDAIIREDPRWMRRQGYRLPDVYADDMERCELLY